MFLDRIRPACLPPHADTLKKRTSEIYRLVRADSPDINKAADYKPRNYTQTATGLCELINSVKLADQTAFCAHGDDDQLPKNAGDPFVVKAKGATGMMTVFQVGMDAFHLDVQTGMFLDLYPYVQWIKNTLHTQL